jgi:predicted dehydrogenase
VTVALGSRRRRRPFTVTFALHGEQGAASADNQRPVVDVDRGDQPADAQAPLAVEPGDAFGAELEHTITCIRTGQPPLVGARDGARAVAVCVAAGRSVAERRPVRVE